MMPCRRTQAAARQSAQGRPNGDVLHPSLPGLPCQVDSSPGTPRLPAGNGTGRSSASSEGTPSGPRQTPVGPSSDREQAQLNFQRISSLQREQLGRALQPEGAEVNLDTITPEQLFPGEQLKWRGWGGGGGGGLR